MPTEYVGLFRTKDGNGDEYILYPTTKAEAVEGLDKYAKKSTVIETTLLAANWVDNLYTLTVTGANGNTWIELYEGSGITDAQSAALQAAGIKESSQSVDTEVLIATGTVPTIDIPIKLVKRGDI